MSDALTHTTTPSAPAGPAEDSREDLAYASQYKLIVLRFRKHKMAMISLVILILLYLGAVFADFLAPYEKNYRIPGVQYSSPTLLRIFEGGKGFSRPFVFGMT
jgi:peptide/nickel transport system permease protein